MRSVYLGTAEDSDLRHIAFDTKLTKSDLIRAAIAIALQRWRVMDNDRIREEVSEAERLSEPPTPEPSGATLPAGATARKGAEAKADPRSAARARNTNSSPPVEKNQRELASSTIA